MIIILITILGLVMRLILANQSFWLDEGASLMFAKLPVNQLFEAVKTDFHPPIFYLLLHYWLPLAGKSEWLIRLPFILIAVATIPVLYLLAKEIFGTKSPIPVLTSLFLALNPLHIYYSQELRMYSLVTLLVVLSWYFLLRRKYLLTGLLNFVGFFTFYGAIFNIISQTIYLFFNKSKHAFQSVLLITIPTLVIFLFWWPIFSIQLQNGNYLSSVLPGWQVLSGTLTLKSLFLIPLKFILGRISFDPQRLYLLIGGFIVFIFFTLAGYSGKNKRTLPVWIAFMVPLIIGVLVSFKTPVLGYWRFLYILPFFTLLLIAGVEELPKIARTATIAWICGTFLFFNLYFWTNIQFQREDWRGFSRFIENKNALIVLPFSGVFAPLNFYEPKVTYLIAQSTLGKNNQDLLQSAKKDFVSKDSLYVMDYMADLTDPDRKILKTIREMGLRELKVYNFNNLGQVYEFQKK